MSEHNSVTVIVKRKIKPGKQKEFEAWVEKVVKEAETFPGHQGYSLLTPEMTGEPDNLLLFKFDSPENLKKWDESEVKRDWLNKIEDITQGSMSFKKVTGLEYWFRHPEVPSNVAPAPYKMALATILGIYPLTVAVTLILGPWMKYIPGPLRGLIMAVLLVVLMTYCVMPLITRLLRRWLFGK